MWYTFRQHLNIIEGKLNDLLAKETKMALDISKLTSEVTANTTVTASVVTLVNSLAAQIAAIPPSNDPTTRPPLQKRLS